MNYNNSKLFPRLSNEDTWEFDFDNEFYNKFNLFMIKNPGLTAKEYANMIKFYYFTEETIVTAFKLFNTYRCTFNKICGPFMISHGKWYGTHKLIDNNNNISLIEENNKLKEENNFLRKKIDEIVKENMDF